MPKGPLHKVVKTGEFQLSDHFHFNKQSRKSGKLKKNLSQTFWWNTLAAGAEFPFKDILIYYTVPIRENFHTTIFGL